MKQIRNLKHLDNVIALNNEIDAFLSKLAKAHNNTNPVDGSKMSPIVLQSSFLEALKGTYNSFYKNKFGIDPTKVEIAYLLDRSPNTNTVVANTDDHGKIQLQDEEEKVNEINLFGVAVIDGASQPKDYAVKRKGGPGKAEGLICPERGKGDFDIDTNGVPNDGTYCWCKYKNGFLSVQQPKVKNKTHGMYLGYSVTKDGVRYLATQKPYINDKVHGDAILYSEYKYDGGGIGLRFVTPTVNGVKHGIEEHWSMTDSGINYLFQKFPYIQGVHHGVRKTFKHSKSGKYFLFKKESYKNIGGTSKPHGDFIIYDSNGGVKVIDKYDKGELISSKCFYKNGKQIKRGDPAASQSWSEEWSCDSNVSWDKTDW